MSYTTYHPVFLNLNGRHVVVVGGGNIALEKMRSLLGSGAVLTVISPSLNPELGALHDNGAFQWIAREFMDKDVSTAFLSIGATDDVAVNRRVFECAERLGRLGNSVDDPEFCNFIMAAIAKAGPLQVAISSAGCSPALAQQLRDRIKNELLTEQAGVLAEFLGDWRPAVKSKLSGFSEKKQFWETVLRSEVPALLSEDRIDEANQAMESMLGAKRHLSPPTPLPSDEKGHHHANCVAWVPPLTPSQLDKSPGTVEGGAREVA